MFARILDLPQLKQMAVFKVSFYDKFVDFCLAVWVLLVNILFIRYITLLNKV